MTIAEALAYAMQIVQLTTANAPAAIKALADFKKLFEDGNEPTKAQIDALIDQINQQSDTIQKL